MKPVQRPSLSMAISKEKSLSPTPSTVKATELTSAVSKEAKVASDIHEPSVFVAAIPSLTKG